MYYFHLQFKQPDVLVLMCDFKSISQVYQHSSPFSVQGSISLWPPALTHPGVCPEHPTAARLDWDLGNEEAKSNTSHCCWLSLTWNGQYDLRTGYPNHFTCRRSGCCVWSVNSGIWKSHVSSHLSVHSRFGLNNSIGVKVQCVSQVSPLHEFFSFAWIQHRQTLSKCSWTCCCCFLHQHNIKENIKTMTHSTLNRFTSVFFAVYYYRAVERFWVDRMTSADIQAHISERYPWQTVMEFRHAYMASDHMCTHKHIAPLPVCTNRVSYGAQGHKLTSVCGTSRQPLRKHQSTRVERDTRGRKA